MHTIMPCFNKQDIIVVITFDFRQTSKGYILQVDNSKVVSYVYSSEQGLTEGIHVSNGHSQLTNQHHIS